MDFIKPSFASSCILSIGNIQLIFLLTSSLSYPPCDTINSLDGVICLTSLNEKFPARLDLYLSFYHKYYSKFGAKRDLLLESMINAFIIKNILSIPSIDLLITFLSMSSELRKFYVFLKVPHKSPFSRFKSNFLKSFNNLVDYTEDISKEINPFLSSILITDITGVEAYVAENNPKFYQSQLRKAKAYSKLFLKDKSNSTFDVENMHRDKCLSLKELKLII